MVIIYVPRQIGLMLNLGCRRNASIAKMRSWVSPQCYGKSYGFIRITSLTFVDIKIYCATRIEGVEQYLFWVSVLIPKLQNHFLVCYPRMERVGNLIFSTLICVLLISQTVEWKLFSSYEPIMKLIQAFMLVLQRFQHFKIKTINGDNFHSKVKYLISIQFK